jgi:hypothetical protein
MRTEYCNKAKTTSVSVRAATMSTTANGLIMHFSFIINTFSQKKNTLYNCGDDAQNAQHKQNATRKVWKNYAQGIQKHLTTAELSVSVNSD